VRVALLAGTLALGGLAAGCGGSDEGGEDASATTEWAGSLCSSLSTWRSSLSSSVESLQEGSLSQSALEDTVGDVRDATETLAEELDDLGRPDAEAGDEAEESLDRLRADLEESVDEIESSIEDVSGVADLATAITSVTSALATMGDALTSTLTTLEGLDAEGELEQAFEEASECDDLTSGS
jgi:chromosome segregation ATPase